ncbi:MAG: dihydroorotate dehydrogenase, partial [Sphaerochaetaceae bacterium]
SALGRVRQKDWPAFLEAIKSEAADLGAGLAADLGAGLAAGLASERGAMLFSGRSSRGFLDADNKMAYVRHKVVDIIRHDSSTVVLVLDGRLESQAGQFVFLWLPGIGEKPFSVATNEPLRFIIKNRGPFTAACMKLKIGDDVYVRGLYGNGVEVLEARHSILIAGGTGEAVLVELARKISKLSVNPAENGRKSVAGGAEAKLDGGSDIATYIGVSSRNGAVMGGILSEYGPCTAVFDDGVPGRVLESIRIEEPDSSAVYIVGPEAFMAKAALKVMELGVPAERIMLSMEKNSMCGIGLCGECECGGRLICQHGTFMGYDFLRKERVL